MCTRQGPTTALVAIILAALGTGSAAREPDASLQACRQLQEKIERLDARRKTGASVRQMEQWKRQRQVYKDQFDHLKCRHWGNQLR